MQLRKAGYLGAAAVVALVAGALAIALLRDDPGAQDPAAMPAIELRPDDAAVVARGREIYAAECAACHGANLEGQPDWRRRLPNGRLPAPPHDETGHTHHHPDEELFALTSKGTAAVVGGGYESDMPGYAEILTEQEILDVLSYIKSRWPDHIRDRHDQLNRVWREAEGR